MNEFTFACPECRQNIAVVQEYAGVGIDCPVCNASIVVPPLGEQIRPRLRTSAASKSKTGLYLALGAVALLAAAGMYFGPKLLRSALPPVALAVPPVATNEPPPAPELTANEIFKNVKTAYGQAASYRARAETVSEMDLSAVNPALTAPVHASASVAICFARPNLYRLEWERRVEGAARAVTNKGAAWCAGQGDSVRNGASVLRPKTRKAALTAASSYAGSQSPALAYFFFNDETNTSGIQFSRTNDDTADGRKCFVLTGKKEWQRFLVWVRKDDFMIARWDLLLDGNIPDSAFAALPAAARAQAIKAAKVKGRIQETYSDIQTNGAFSSESFARPLAAAPVKLRGQDTHSLVRD